MTTRAVILRSLIRNDEALVDHLVPWITTHLAAGEHECARSIAKRLGVIGQRLNARRAELQLLSLPAAPAPIETTRGSLVTDRAAQPAS